MCFCVCLLPEQCCICAPDPSSPPPPVLLSQASSRPELSIKLASYREQWSCGVCLGQRVHIDLSNKRPAPNGHASHDALLPDKKFPEKKVAAPNVSPLQSAVGQNKAIWRGCLFYTTLILLMSLELCLGFLQCQEKEQIIIF